MLTKYDQSLPHSFVLPTKKIHDGPDMSFFLASQAFGDIMTFLMQLNHSMFPRSTSHDNSVIQRVEAYELQSPFVTFSDTVKKLCDLLNQLDTIIDEVPLDSGPRRFGNVSFRKWSELVEERASGLLEQYLPAEVVAFKHDSEVDATAELRAYFLGSFGSAQRLDYGTGHELSFLAFLGGIWKLGGFPSPKPGEEERGIVLGVINQ
jgi:serine/threonine-protein phosphatase 2A activator